MSVYIGATGSQVASPDLYLLLDNNQHRRISTVQTIADLYQLPVGGFNMTLEEFLALEDGAVISPEQAQLLNDCLARLTIADIPSSHRDQVADYLLLSLNIESVRTEIIDSLDGLLNELQAQAK